MAQYRIDNRILSEEEYQDHCSSNWFSGLFLVGAIIAAWYVNSLMPEDWPKYMRFPVIIFSAVVCGGILGVMADYIRKAMFSVLGVGALAGMGYWIWSII